MNKEKPTLLSRYSNVGLQDDLNFLDAAEMEADGIKVKCTCRETEKGRFVTEFSADERYSFTTSEPSTTTEQITTTASPAAQLRHEELVEENLEVGVMFASKPVVQAIINPFVGAMTNRYLLTSLYFLILITNSLIILSYTSLPSTIVILSL